MVNDATFLGLLIGALVVLVGFMVTVITPIIKLNTTITKLNDKLDHVIEDKDTQKKRITQHGKEIDELKGEAIRQDIIIKDHEKRIGTLEGLHKRQ